MEEGGGNHKMRAEWGTSEHRVLCPPDLWRGVKILDRMGVRQGTEGGRESAGSPIAHPSARCLTAPTLEVYSWRNGQRPGLGDTKTWARSKCEPEINEHL